jgi:hypothetical protein
MIEPLSQQAVALFSKINPQFSIKPCQHLPLKINEIKLFLENPLDYLLTKKGNHPL